MKLILIRDILGEDFTLGQFFIGDKFLSYTLENAWLNNEPRISCIPEGTYELSTKEYGRYWDKYQVEIPILFDVPERSQILIHPGNYPKDTLGCILPGDSRDEDKGAVWNSRNTWHAILPDIYKCNEIEIKYEINS